MKKLAFLILLGFLPGCEPKPNGDSGAEAQYDNRQIPGQLFIARAVFSPDSKWVATVYNAGNGWIDPGHKTITLWEVATGKPVWTRRQNKLPVMNVAFISGTDRMLVENGRTVSELSVVTGKVMDTFLKNRERVTAIAVSPDGKFALLGLDSGNLEIFDLATKKVSRTLEGDQGLVNDLVISGDGRLALSSTNPTLGRTNDFTLWEIPTGKVLLADPVKGGKGFGHPFSLSPDGKFAVCPRSQLVKSGANKNRIPEWRYEMVLLAMPTGKVVRAYPFGIMGSCTFTPDGKGLLGQIGGKAGKEATGLWKVENGEKVWSVKAQEFDDGRAVAAFSPDGKLVFSVHGWERMPGGGSATIKLLDAATGKLIRSWKTSAEH